VTLTLTEQALLSAMSTVPAEFLAKSLPYACESDTNGWRLNVLTKEETNVTNDLSFII
jgi:hypothetical protein